MSPTTVRVGDGGLIEVRGFGLRRMKALLLLAQHPELDDQDWRGEVAVHFGKATQVLGAVHRQPTEISMEALSA